jgi:glycosyltransferase involved in cell wall biosynthesis
VTIAVCTWNRRELLRQTLTQLERMSVPAEVRLDFVVVNNNCTDDTDGVIDEFRTRLPLHRLFEGRAGVASARNAALAWATADYLAFIDDDALADGSWLVEFVAATHAFPDAAAIGGVIEPWFPAPVDPDLLEAFHWLKIGFCGLDYGRAPGPLPNGWLIHGPNMAYRMAALKDLRFHPGLGGTPTSTMGGDERDLLDRLRAAGGTVVWWPAMRVRHHVASTRTTLDYCLRFAADKGRERVLTEPPWPGSFLFGAPRWLWRRWFMAYLKYLAASVTPAVRSGSLELLSGREEGGRSRRVRALTWRKEFSYIGGMIRGNRDRQREIPGREADPSYLAH